jgi:hypothetical protein
MKTKILLSISLMLAYKLAKNFTIWMSVYKVTVACQRARLAKLQKAALA